MLLDVLTDVPGAVEVLRVRKKRRHRTRHCSVGICDDYLGRPWEVGAVKIIYVMTAIEQHR